MFGYAKDFGSGIERVLVNYGIGWKVVDVVDDMWDTTWQTEGLEEGKHPIKAKIIDQAGNESVTEYKATVVSTFWPFFTFSALVIAIALYFALDPRTKEWAEITVEVEKHQRMYINELRFGLEEEYEDD